MKCLCVVAGARRRWLLPLLALVVSIGTTEGGQGRYSGTWQSDSNGHHGRISGRFRQIDSSTYRARYTGTFLGVVPFTYSTPMRVTGYGPNGETHLVGDSRLPLFGRFHSNAVMTPYGVEATFRSRKNSGRYSMRRR